MCPRDLENLLEAEAVPVLNLLTLITAPSVALVTLDTRCCKEVTTDERSYYWDQTVK